MQSTHNTLSYPAWNPLEFWRVIGYVYPHVSNFTKAMLALPAISVTSSQRACILPENANMFIFIKHNKAFYDIFNKSIDTYVLSIVRFMF